MDERGLEFSEWTGGEFIYWCQVNWRWLAAMSWASFTIDISGMGRSLRAIQFTRGLGATPVLTLDDEVCGPDLAIS